MVAQEGGKDNGTKVPEFVPEGKAEYRVDAGACSGAAWTVAGKSETVRGRQDSAQGRDGGQDGGGVSPAMAGAGARAGNGHAGRDAQGGAETAAHGEHRFAEPSARRDGPAGRPAPDRGGRRDRRDGAAGVRFHRGGATGDHGGHLSGHLLRRKKRTPRGWHLRAFRGKSVWYWINHWMYQL